MNYFETIILAVIQGLTEFLPISSSAHLVFLQSLFNLQNLIGFDIMLHLGTLGSILVYFRKNLIAVIKDGLKNRNLFLLVLIGTLPAALTGFFLSGKIGKIFNSSETAAILLILNSFLLFSTKLGKSKKSLSHLKWHDGLFVGLFQALALLPGISRSGSTITAGLLKGFRRQTAFLFSFYLAIPAILGAIILEKQSLFTFLSRNFIQAVLGVFVSGVVGFWALRILEKTLKSTKFYLFGFYCLFLGLAILLISYL